MFPKTLPPCLECMMCPPALPVPNTKRLDACMELAPGIRATLDMLILVKATLFTLWNSLF